jgi:hypothetical protein
VSLTKSEIVGENLDLLSQMEAADEGFQMKKQPNARFQSVMIP